MQEQRLIRADRRKQHANTPGVADHHRADFQEFQADRLRLVARGLGASERQGAQPFHQDVGQAGEHEPELVGGEVVTAGAIGEQPQLRLLDAVLHLAAAAVELLVERLRLALEIGHDIAGIVAFVGVLGARYPPRVAPGGGRVVEFHEGALMGARGFVLRLEAIAPGLGPGVQPRILGQPPQ